LRRDPFGALRRCPTREGSVLPARPRPKLDARVEQAGPNRRRAHTEPPAKIRNALAVAIPTFELAAVETLGIAARPSLRLAIHAGVAGPPAGSRDCNAVRRGRGGNSSPPAIRGCDLALRWLSSRTRHTVDNTILLAILSCRHPEAAVSRTGHLINQLRMA